MDTTQIQRAWLISDIHFGVRSSSLEWLEIQKEYFQNFFIPTLKNNLKDGDAVFVLGDIFDSRQYLNILVMNEALIIFKEISEIVPVIMIIGNHDIYRKLSNTVNSLEIFRTLPNIKILQDPTSLEFKNSTGFFLPWQDTHKQEMEILGNAQETDYLFCHADMSGFKYNRQVLLEVGLDPESIANYKAVYTGHIHYAQKQRNIRMIGSPMELTRSDIGNKKSLWLVDLDNNTETEFVNTESPRFLRIKLTSLFDLTISEINKKFKNNFVDVFVGDDWSTIFPFGQFTDLLDGQKKIEYILTGDSEIDESHIITDGKGTIEMSTLIDLYVEELPHSTSVKKKLKEVANLYYKKTLKIQEGEV